MAPESFEILLVLNGPPCATPSIVEAFRRTHPRHVVRMIVVDEASTSNARNIGLASAQGQHITFMDDDDFVSPGYMEALLDAAEPGVVPVAFIVDVAEEPRRADGARARELLQHPDPRARRQDSPSRGGVLRAQCQRSEAGAGCRGT